MDTNKNAPKYKVGDKVKIVSERTKRMNPDGFMDKYLDTTMTIREAFGTGGYKMEEDRQDTAGFGEDGWFWDEEMIDHEATANLNNINKKIKKLNIKVKVKPRPDLTNSETENSAPQTPAKITGFERAVYGDTFWSNGMYGTVVQEAETKGSYDDRLFKAANYYTNEALAKWCSRSDNLTRKMRRWAAEHNTEPIDCTDLTKDKWYIFYDEVTKNVEKAWTLSRVEYFCVYFDKEEIAKAAIAEFGDEIKWLAENRPEWF